MALSDHRPRTTNALRWLSLVPVFALLAVTACSGEDGSSTSTASSPSTTSADTTTTSLAATEDAATEDIVAVFDGTTCAYEGPDEASPTAILSVRFVNQSTVPAELFITTSHGEVLERQLSLVGTDVAGDSDLDASPDAFALELGSDPGESNTGNVLLAPGTWIVDCHTTGGGHFWFVAAIESS